ncbi:MAG TPA: ATP-binding protein [Bryobacteraceae bacterium]|nr:ATP-binding protein [Bryobacteraceae bacterium]
MVAVLYGFTFLFAASLLYRYGGVSKDAGWTWRVTATGAVVDSVSAQGSVLTPGARIVAINGDPRAAAAGPRPWLQAVRPGGSYRVAWTAPGSSQRREATLVMGWRKSPRDLLMGLCDLFLSLCFFTAGLFVWRARPSGAVARSCRTAALLMAFYLTASAVGPISPLLSGFSATIYLTNRLIFPFYLAAGCAFFAVFPTGERPSGVWRAWLIALWAGAGIVWAILLPFRALPFLGLEGRLRLLSGLDLNTRPELGLVAFRHGYVALCGLFLFAVITHNYRRLENAAMRLRVRWVIFGAIFGIAPAVAASLALTIVPHATGAVLVYYSLSTLSIAAIPATVTYAVACHRLMGIRVTLLPGVQRLAARRALQFATLAPAAIAAVYLWRHRDLSLAELWSQRPGALGLIVAGLLVALLRKELLDFADGMLLRAPYDRDRVTGGLLETLLRQESFADIARAAAARIEPALQPERLLAYCAGGGAEMRLVYSAADDAAPSSITLNRALLEKGPVFLKPPLPGLADMALAAPVAAGEGAQAVGVLLLGRKRSGQAYTATDLDVLEDIARQVYLALKLRELEQAQAFNDGRTDLLAQVSHELRSPLHGVVGLTGLLLDTPLSEEQQEYTQLIRRSSELMVSIANDLIDFTRSEAGRLKLDAIRFEWAPLLQDVITIAAQRASGKHLEVILQMDPSTPAASIGDPTRVRQVLLNLLDNAVKFTDRGWVRMRSSAGVAQSICIEVADSGPGIPDHLRPRLFEPYQQGAAASQEGAGLGLAISQRLVGAMGGSLTYDSRPGRGAAFAVTLPAMSGSQLVSEQPLAGVRVLCIEQLAIGAQALHFTLTALGARVSTRNTEILDQDVACESFDVVVYSAAFDSRDIACAVRNIRRTERSTPVVVLHHGAAPLSDREAGILGPIYQVRKPAVGKTLLRAIRAARASSTTDADAGASAPVDGACAGARVLLVEDDPATKRITEMMLSRLGCIVFASPTARQALRALETAPFDIALIDSKLPDMDGADLTQRIRSLGTRQSRIPVVALSGDPSAESRARFFDAGADDYVIKPAAIQELRDVIHLRADHAGTA